MKNDIKNAFDKISPVRSDDEIFVNVMRRSNMSTEKKKNIKFKKAIITPIAAVIGLLATAVTAGAIYEGIQYLQRSEYGQIEDIVEKINTFVYEDSNENMKMSVDEVLTDGKLTYMIVHYEALNEEGTERLDRVFDPDCLECHGNLRIVFGYEASGNYGTRELEEYRTEKDRYYLLTCYKDRATTDMEEITIKYNLGNLFEKTAVLSLNETVETKWYKLKSDKHGTDLFTPEYIEISDLTYTVYGMNHKVYEEIREPGRYMIRLIVPQEFDVTDYIDFSFVLADGTIFETTPGGGIGSMWPDEENLNTDLIICDGQYKTLDYENYEWKYIFPSQEIIGVNICGVTYELEPIE